MSLPAILFIGETGEIGAKAFTRVRDDGDKVTFVNKAILGSPSVRKDQLQVRAREDRSSRSYNISRSLGIIDPVGKPHEAVINLTLNTPVSGVIDASTLLDMLSDVVTIVTQFDRLAQEDHDPKLHADMACVSAAQFLEI
jgi:hypothetical protein